MPHFSSSVSDLQQVGPIVDLKVYPSAAAIAALQKAGEAVPNPIPVSALIDTGASHTVMKNGTAGALGLHPIDKTAICTPSSHNVSCYRYDMTLLFPTASKAGLGPIRYTGRVIEAPMPAQNIDCLIGRDILEHVVMVYNGPEETFSFSF